MTRDIESLNRIILSIDCDELDADALDRRIELGLAMLVSDGPAADLQCGQYTCNGYWPDQG
ncbi:MAG: hypothetical protein D6696_09275 [Acidobacteria bacterium]|nr:MAG: hypothetical protein D6696_09275 [Acidobacteriota bacterium]